MLVKQSRRFCNVLNQPSARSQIPYNLYGKITCSMVSKAPEKSRRVRSVTDHLAMKKQSFCMLKKVLSVECFYATILKPVIN